MKSSASQTASQILSLADELGWSVCVRGNDILTISKDIVQNNLESFSVADSEYYSILSLLPTSRPGSIWGTDGGGVGALEATKTGRFIMNKSGGNKNVIRALKRLI